MEKQPDFRFNLKQKKKEIRAVKKVRSAAKKSVKKAQKTINKSERNIGKTYYLEHSGRKAAQPEQYRQWCEKISKSKLRIAENDQRIQALESDIRLLKQELAAAKKAKKSSSIPDVSL